MDHHRRAPMYTEQTLRVRGDEPTVPALSVVLPVNLLSLGEIDHLPPEARDLIEENNRYGRLPNPEPPLTAERIAAAVVDELE